MGQSHSDENPRRRTREDLTRELARRFADKCFTSLEIYSYKDVFKSLADDQDGVHYLKEETLSRFLELPDVLHASPVLFRMISYIGAFPFLNDAPVVLGLEEMVMVVTILTNRYQRVLARGATDRTKLLFKSLAVHDRAVATAVPEEASKEAETKAKAQGTASHVPGFAVDEAGDEADDEDDDDLEIAAFELLDIDDAVKQGDAPSIKGAMIPGGNFHRIVMLLLLVAPLDAQESLALHANRVVGDELESLRSTARNVLHAFLNVETSPGIKYSTFNRIIPVNFPYLFQGFNALFEHFLFSKNLDFSKHDNQAEEKEKAVQREVAQPLLQDKADIMNFNVLSQLSFFIPGANLFRKLRLLYSGAEAGFSMGSFETKVFNWRAPTILLVRGSRIQDEPRGGQEASFAASLPPKRFPHGSKGDRLTFGMYIGQPWKHTSKECFGDSDSLLFQLEPVHDVFPASAINRDYVSFTKAPTNRPLLAAGCPHPRPTQSHRHDGMLALGPVSLLLDGSFEFGVFNHDYTSQGGAYHNSVSRRYDFQDRFEVESLEVWGCGGDEEAQAQAARWAWEAREAEARRKINLGTSGIEADRALLEMAGLIGGGRSGGSMA
ncbi:Restriction of telomere capping protein 5 like [Verticillium longisporum]|uniref:Restriction of telomere capping protein 5 n=1 Tax=Verticillium longisporum TaxID=100787 RepID=A0A8I2ZVB2_VERLO|nr:Restriction of telomere capping protein 5 like [Verticillium longisporum]